MHYTCVCTYMSVLYLYVGMYNVCCTLLGSFSFTHQSENDVMVIVYIARILEKVVPLMAHPDQSFLNSIEEEMVKLILKQGPNVCIVQIL